MRIKFNYINKNNYLNNFWKVYEIKIDFKIEILTQNKIKIKVH